MGIFMPNNYLCLKVIVAKKKKSAISVMTVPNSTSLKVNDEPAHSLPWRENEG